MSPEIILIAHNLRSCQNVGSILRTADGLGVSEVYLSGYTPYPVSENDERLPYLREKIDKRIKKTSLGAESSIIWHHIKEINELINKLKSDEYQIVALEQSAKSVDLDKFQPEDKLVLILGREVDGIEKEILAKVDKVVSIPMLGKKESFNVAQAAAMAVYKFRYF